MRRTNPGVVLEESFIATVFVGHRGVLVENDASDRVGLVVVGSSHDFPQQLPLQDSLKSEPRKNEDTNQFNPRPDELRRKINVL